ncbi:MAG: amidohydrolase family protein [Saprospiraceae bacterium]|nr:amidohydrolase family protein [Saprospiraceae bacterium]
MNRRDILKVLNYSAWPLILPVKELKLRQRENNSFLAKDDQVIIEWNAHIFSPDLKKYPFHPQATYQPDVSKQAADPLAAYFDRMKEEGIDRAVIVHPEPYGDDHSLILDCLKRDRNRLRGTSLFYPKDPHAPAKLKALVEKEPHILATRFHALKGNEKYLTSFTDAGVINLWRQAYELDLVIELHIGPDYAAQAAELLVDLPDSKVVIDHLAEPHLGTGVQFADVLELSRFPNCYMKLSGLNHFAQDAPYYESAIPFTRRVIQEFGKERVIWGSGTPEIVNRHMEGYSPEEIAMVKGGNIRRLLNW